MFFALSSKRLSFRFRSHFEQLTLATCMHVLSLSHVLLTVPLYFEQVAEMCRDGGWIDVFARAGYITHDKLLAVYWDQWHMSFVFLNRLLSECTGADFFHVWRGWVYMFVDEPAVSTASSFGDTCTCAK